MLSHGSSSTLTPLTKAPFDFSSVRAGALCWTDRVTVTGGLVSLTRPLEGVARDFELHHLHFFHRQNEDVIFLFWSFHAAVTAALIGGEDVTIKFLLLKLF